MNDTTQFDLMNRADLSRIQDYFEFLYEIMQIKILKVERVAIIKLQ